jgi:hypothetical protein
MLRRVLLSTGAVLCLAAPAVATAAPELTTTQRLNDKRFVVSGPRAYDIGTEAGRYPAMGFHTRGEMGGIWSPPIKLLDGIWFGLDGQWIGTAPGSFTSGWGYAKMRPPDTAGLKIERTDFVPDARRGVLIGLKLTNPGQRRTVRLMADAHSELMFSYPWGETKPFNQLDFNLPDSAAFEDGALVFTEQGTPPAANAEPHDWAAVVGTTATPVAHDTGAAFRGPQGDVICPPSGPNPENALPPVPCDDTAYGKGVGGQLDYEVTVPARGSTTVWFAVAGSETGSTEAKATMARMLADPEGELRAKIAQRVALSRHTRLSLPGDPKLAQAVDWGKQNLADLTLAPRDLDIRETNAGVNYPPAEAHIARLRFYGAGFPDYPWLFAVDGEYTAFAAVTMGQFGPIEDHLRALKTVSQVINGDSGKVIHETVNDGSVFFGALADAGNTDETAKFPSTVALVWRWTGDNAFLDEMYGFAKSNMEFIVNHLDADGDGWPEGLGNVERNGMGVEKLDNTVYTIRGLSDLADMAEAKGDTATRTWAEDHLKMLESRFEQAWYMPNVPGYADSLDDPANPANDNTQIYQRHWIGVTPTEVELNDRGTPLPGLAPPDRADAVLNVHETRCYGDASGMFHTGKPGCDNAPDSPTELHAFTIGTSIIAVGEGNYGRMGNKQQARWTKANADQIVPGVEQPGAMPEIASPSAIPEELGLVINRPFPERPSVMQAWGSYGTVYPVVHQQLGIAPDMGRGRLSVVAQPPSSAPIAGDAIRVGGGTVSVSARQTGKTWTTTVDPRVTASLRIGAVVPAGATVREVQLDGRSVAFDTRLSHRGLEVTVPASSARAHTVTVTIR